VLHWLAAGICCEGRPATSGSALPSFYACQETAHPRGHRDRPADLLDGLARDIDIFELMSELLPLHPRDNTFPGEVFLRLAADALDWCGASRVDPLPLEGLRERFLPECTFRGRQNKKLQYAVLAAAAFQGGTEPDLLDEVAWWQTDDFWQYALFATVAYIRAAASTPALTHRDQRRGRTLGQVEQIAEYLSGVG
jgi:hypothetical protein